MITSTMACYADLNFSVQFQLEINKVGNRVDLTLGDRWESFIFDHNYQAASYAFWLNSWVTPLTVISDPRITHGAAVITNIKNDSITLRQVIDEVESRLEAKRQ